MSNGKKLITINNCRIENSSNIIIPELDWEFSQGESWLVIGPNGGGKADFVNALAGQLKIVPNPDKAGEEFQKGTDPCKKNLEQRGQTPVEKPPVENQSQSEGTDPSDSQSCCAKGDRPLNSQSVLSKGDRPLSLYSNIFNDSCEIVSLERAAKLIQEERENDESEYIEGGVDIGRTGRVFISEVVCGKIKRDTPLPDFAKTLDENEAVKLCGIQKILDRGLKYMSTGEIRRTLLARALISGKKLLILSDPFAGLDIESRSILLQFFDKISKNQTIENGTEKTGTQIILGMERWHEIPESITHVIEFRDKKVSFCGKRQDYEKIIAEREAESAANRTAELNVFSGALENTIKESSVLCEEQKETDESDNTKRTPLIEMHNVNVGWSDNRVLIDLNWTLYQGEHWLVRGPNGCGKTTFLELITGDNRQVFCNDIKLFGNRRGSGETIWDIKKQLGIVSYRLHVEYRMVGGTSLLNVIISGFRDSIGLYEAATDVEKAAAKKWLELGGFEGRENETFGNLSYGEQRAILILRSAVKSPKILILDEPCHGLDEKYREKILNLMNLIGEKGTTTMLHVTHDPSEVLECEKHILEFHPGENPMYKILEKNI